MGSDDYTMSNLPPTHWKMTQLIADKIEEYKKNENVTKKEALDKIEEMLATMMQKIVSHPTCSSYCVFYSS